MYNLADYGHMLADHVRMGPYAHPLQTAVTPNSVVLDIGTSMGIHALLACKFGARKVYAIEPNDAIELAQRLAEVNGFADRIEFIQDISTNITLPEPANIIVSDLRGALPLFDQHIPSIIDARQRHLAPNGILIPQKDILWASVIEAPVIYRNLLKAWDDPYGFDIEPVRQMVLNQWQTEDTDLIRPTNLLTVPAEWTVLDYNTITHPDVHTDLVQQATRDGVAHGLLLWFDAQLADGIGFSNAPHVKKIAAVYGRAFFPFLKPVSLSTGDTIHLTVQATLSDDGYCWQWNTRIFSQANPNIVLADFVQSTEA